MNKIEIDNYYEPESKTIRLDEADLNQIDTNTMQILLKENYKLKKENKRLKEQIEVYEDPEDLTLMFMYCDIEAKDKIKTLKEQIKKCKKDNNELRKDKLECYMKNTTILTSLNKFIEYLEKRYNKCNRQLW